MTLKDLNVSPKSMQNPQSNHNVMVFRGGVSGKGKDEEPPVGFVLLQEETPETQRACGDKRRRWRYPNTDLLAS